MKKTSIKISQLKRHQINQINQINQLNAKTTIFSITFH